MANKKFSDFTSKTSPSDVSFVVGYDGSDNVRISIANMNSAYLPLAGGTMTGNLILDDNSGASPQIQFINGGNDTGEILLNSSGKLEISTGGTDRLVISSGDTEFTGDITLADNKKAIFGAGNDLEIYHDATDSSIVNATGHLNIINNSDDKSIYLQTDNGSGGTTTYLKVDGLTNYTEFPVAARFMDSVQLQFGDSGDGHIVHDGADMTIQNSFDDGDLKFKCDNGSGGVAEYFWLDGGISKTRYGLEATFGDNVKLTFGNVVTPDLEIYHDGSNSYIDETGTGDLYIQSGGANKLQTSSTGVTITGQVNISALNTAPSSASDTGTVGEIRFTADYIFVCVASNTWKRVAIATW